MSHSLLVLSSLLLILGACGKKEVPTAPQAVKYVPDLFDKDRTLVKPAAFQFSLEKTLRMNLDYVYNETKGHAYSMNVVSRNGNANRFLELTPKASNFDVPPSAKGSYEKRHLLHDPANVLLTYTMLPPGEIVTQDEKEGESVLVGYYIEAQDYFLITDLCVFSRKYTDNCRVKKAINQNFHKDSIDVFDFYNRRQNARMTIIEDKIEKNHREVMTHIEAHTKDLNKQREEIDEMSRVAAALEKTVETNRLFALNEITAAKARLQTLETGLKTAQDDLKRIDAEGKSTAGDLAKTKTALTTTNAELAKVREALAKEVTRLEAEIGKVRAFTQEVLDTHKKEMKALEDRLAEAAKKVDARIAEVEKVNTAQAEELKVHKNGIESLVADLAKANDRIKALEDAMKTKASAEDLMKTQVELGKVRDHAKAIEAKLDMHLKAFDTYKEETKKATDGLRADLDALKKQVEQSATDLTKKIEDAQKALDKRIEEAEKVNTTQANELKAHKAALDQLRKDVDALTPRVKTAEDEIKLRATIEQLKAVEKKFEDYQKATDKKIEGLQGEITELKKKLTENETAFGKLQEKVTGLDMRATQLAMNVDANDKARVKDIADLKKELGTVVAGIAPLKQQLTETQEATKKLATTDDIKKATDAVKALEASLGDTQKRLEALETKLKAMEKPAADPSVPPMIPPTK